MNSYIEEYKVPQAIQYFSESLPVPVRHSVILRAANADRTFLLELETANFFKNIEFAGANYDIEITIKNKNGEVIEIK